jgi:hypothetical protein
MYSGLEKCRFCLPRPARRSNRNASLTKDRFDRLAKAQTTLTRSRGSTGRPRYVGMGRHRGVRPGITRVSNTGSQLKKSRSSHAKSLETKQRQTDPD